MIDSLRKQRRLANAAAVLLALLAAAPAAHASHTGDDAAADQQLVQSANQLLAALRAFENAPLELREARQAQLLQIATQRRDRMLALLARNPQLTALRSLPTALRDRLPPAVQAVVEQEVRVSGVVIGNLADDFARGVSHQQFFLHAGGAAEPLELHAADAALRERDLLGWAGRRVTLTASRLGHHLLVADKSTVQVQPGDAAATSGTVAAATTTTATGTVVQGDQKTLVILANFTDSSLTCSAGDVSNRLFGSTGSTLNNAYRQSSGGLVSFSGQVVGPFPIPYSSGSTCDYNGWANAADAAAKAAGIDPAAYARVNYVTPISNTCNWSGMGNMPGRRSWVQMCGATGVFAHELGHNLSLHHASTPASEYGDFSDPMGGARLVQHNGANRAMAGWMAPGSVQDVATGGSFALAALELVAPASPQVLRIAKPDTKEYYYVSLRQALDIDAGLAAAFQNTLSVHRASGTLPARTYLLQNLAAGQSFVDAANGIQVTLQGLSGNVATVGVGFGSGSCVRSAPLVSASPNSQSGPAGKGVGFTVLLTNQNSAACGSSSFAFSQTLPTGFSGSFATPNLVVAAGSSATAIWTVSVPAGTLEGAYTFDATASEGGASNAAAAHAGYLVVSADTMPPTVTITSPQNASTVGSRVAIAASATDNIGVQAVEFYIDASLIARSTQAPYTATWNARKAGVGLHTIKVRAIDASGNAAEQSISVTR